MGPLVVGMMLGASVCSSGTFIGGPATGTKEGLVWTVCIYASVFMSWPASTRKRANCSSL